MGKDRFSFLTFEGMPTLTLRIRQEKHEVPVFRKAPVGVVDTVYIKALTDHQAAVYGP